MSTGSKGGVIGQQRMNGPDILQLIREYIQVIYLTKEQTLIDGFSGTTWFNIAKLNAENGLIGLLKTQFADTKNIKEIALDVLKYGLNKTFGNLFDNSLDNVVNKDGSINIDTLKSILVEKTFAEYVKKMKFTYLVYYTNETFNFFDVNDPDITNKLLSLKLKFPSYGTKTDRNDASICIAS